MTIRTHAKTWRQKCSTALKIDGTLLQSAARSVTDRSVSSGTIPGELPSVQRSALNASRPAARRTAAGYLVQIRRFVQKSDLDVTESEGISLGPRESRFSAQSGSLPCTAQRFDRLLEPPTRSVSPYSSRFTRLGPPSWERHRMRSRGRSGRCRGYSRQRGPPSVIGGHSRLSAGLVGL
jgi:hypothetical protein